MVKVALLGAGGKMGVRLATNLKASRFDVQPVEISEEGRARLKIETGLDTVDQDTALAGADVVLMAVPDRLIRRRSVSRRSRDVAAKAVRASPSANDAIVWTGAAGRLSAGAPLVASTPPGVVTSPSHRLG